MAEGQKQQKAERWFTSMNILYVVCAFVAGMSLGEAHLARIAMQQADLFDHKEAVAQARLQSNLALGLMGLAILAPIAVNVLFSDTKKK